MIYIYKDTDSAKEPDYPTFREKVDAHFKSADATNIDSIKDYLRMCLKRDFKSHKMKASDFIYYRGYIMAQYINTLVTL